MSTSSNPSDSARNPWPPEMLRERVNRLDNETADLYARIYTLHQHIAEQDRMIGRLIEVNRAIVTALPSRPGADVGRRDDDDARRQRRGTPPPPAHISFGNSIGFRGPR